MDPLKQDNSENNSAESQQTNTVLDASINSTDIDNSINADYSLVNHIEAILFWKGDPMTVNDLAKITGAKKDDIAAGLITLKSNLAKRGVVLIEHANEFTLGTNPKSSLLIETVRTEELSKDLGKASLETLAIILYQGPIRRSDIDYIRGVNSNFILRNLLIRGLIERRADANNSRTHVYMPSLDLLRFMGITHVSELQDFDKVKEAIQEFKTAEEDEESCIAPDASEIILQEERQITPESSLNVNETSDSSTKNSEIIHENNTQNQGEEIRSDGNELAQN